MLICAFKTKPHYTHNQTEAFAKNAGIALIVFTVLLLFTMVLHPAGSNVHGLISKAEMIIGVHGVALLSIPVGWVGFWGLSRRIGQNHFGSMFAFFVISAGLIAEMMAAAINGLVLPLYLQGYQEGTDDVLDSVQPILRYGFSINKAFDYIYTAAFSIAILIWSVIIVKTNTMSRWIGITGICISLIMIAVFFGGMMAANSLRGLRVFLGGVLVWIFVVGLDLARKRVDKIGS